MAAHLLHVHMLNVWPLTRKWEEAERILSSDASTSCEPGLTIYGGVVLEFHTDEASIGPVLLVCVVHHAGLQVQTASCNDVLVDIFPIIHKLTIHIKNLHCPARPRSHRKRE